MKKRKTHIVPTESCLSLSRKRYINPGWTFTPRGEMIYCHDVISGEDVKFTIDEWDKIRNTCLTEVEYNLLKDSIISYWNTVH